jgi:hypothetical protein
MELVASADVLGAMQDLVIAEDPEALQTLTEEDNDIDDEGDDDASSVNNNDLPRWAQRGGFTDGELPRTHALLVAFLPAYFLAHLPTLARMTARSDPHFWSLRMRTVVSKGRAGSTVVLRYGGRAVSISKAALTVCNCVLVLVLYRRYWRRGGARGGDVGIGRDDTGGCRVKN